MLKCPEILIMEELFKCPDCGNTYKLRSSLLKHMGIHKIHQCLVCDQKIQGTRNMIKHCKDKHDKSDKILRCAECKEIFIDNASLGNHSKVHKEIPCRYCDYKCKGLALMKMHVNKSHWRLYQCPVCRFETYGSKILKEHRNTHLRMLNNSEASCMFCDIKCSNLIDLLSHLEDKHGDKIITAEIANKPIIIN